MPVVNKKWLKVINRNRKYALITKKPFQPFKKHLVQKLISLVFQNVLVKPRQLLKNLSKIKPGCTRNSVKHNKRSRRKQSKKLKPEKFKDTPNLHKARNYA